MSDFISTNTTQKNEWFHRHKTEIVIGMLMLAAFGFRLWTACMLQNLCRAEQVYDDFLMIQYSDLAAHFSEANPNSLIKDMSFPFFLALCRATGINYTVMLTLSWTAAALMLFALARSLSKSRWIPFFCYLFVLFCPYAFSLAGQLIYRNAILVPFFLMTFCCLLQGLVLYCKKDEPGQGWKAVFLAVASGLLLTFSYYIKEDGVWLMAVLAVVSLAQAILLLVRRKVFSRQSRVCLLLAIFIPFGVFGIETFSYKKANENAFGVSVINNRTGGEFGQFIENVYAIQCDDRTEIVWAPYIAVARAFDASPTLQSMEGLREAVLANNWFENGSKPIIGDFLGWVLLEALQKTDNWHSLPQLEEDFAKVNAELEEAFANGSLSKENKIFLVSSSGARDMDEVWNVFKDDFSLMYWILHPVVEPGDANYTEGMEEKYDAILDATGLDMRVFSQENFRTGRNVACAIANVYQWINPILLVIGLISWFYMLFTCRKKRSWQAWLLFGGIFFMTGMALGYGFATCWFTRFLIAQQPAYQSFYWLTYYSAGSLSLMYLVLAFSLILAGRLFKFPARKAKAKA